MKILFYVLAALFLLFLVWGQFLGRKWANDVDEFKISQGNFAFRSQRDAIGAWHIDTENEESLWFAFGFLQAHDREYQIEILRKLAKGELASMLGESQLTRDRFMRLSSRVARDEWQRLDKNSLMARAAMAFVAGRNFYARAPRTELPIEFRLLNVARAEIPDWEPWEVLAMGRMHAWELSTDMMDEVEHYVMQKNFGSVLGNLLLPTEREIKRSVALYEQAGIAPARPQLLGHPGSRDLPAPFLPAAETQATHRNSPGSGYEKQTLFSQAFEEWGLGAHLGASNLWIAADSHLKTPPHLCNDAHLALSWPSTVYPLHYRIARADGEKLSAQGFVFPGTPAMVFGQVEHRRGDAPPRQLAWGITVAGNADTQDLIRLNSATLARARKVREVFKVRDLGTGQLSERSIDETWTDLGPRVDEILKWLPPATSPGALALDWMGFRKAPTPLEFFIRRNIFGAESLAQDLAQKWVFPAVNFSWVERGSEKDIHFGHAVTGLLFDRAHRSKGSFLSESDVRSSRRVSTPAERPYLYHAWNSADAKDFYLVSANQKVWPDALSDRLGLDWSDDLRAQRIIDKKEENFRKIGWSQNDTYSPGLRTFLSAVRHRLDVNRLCSPEHRALCEEVVQGLDVWEGKTWKESWEPSFAFLWQAQLKQGLWPRGSLEQDRDQEDFFATWNRSNAAARFLRSLLNENSQGAQQRALFEKVTKKNVDDVIVDSFRSAFGLLISRWGLRKEAWTWDQMHAIRWTHPFSMVPGAIGTVLRNGMWGAPQAVAGGADSPSRMDFSWRPSDPLAFPAVHGAVMRMCTTFGENDKLQSRWSAPAGVSGNPFSKWAWPLARDYFFKDELF